MPTDEAVFTLTFTKGLADRNRLPFEQVIRTLNEFRELVQELGKRLQREAGVEEPTGDFGLEILAGPGGYAFSKGSLIATAVATQDVAVARQVFALILGQTKGYSKSAPTDASIEGGIVARRMLSIARFQQPSKTFVAFQLKGAAAARGSKAMLDQKAYLHLVESQKANLRVDGLQLFGRLRQLNDRSRSEEGDGHFWGELVTDNLQVWRLRFDHSTLRKVLPLFMQQVEVRGDATYFGPARSPRLKVSHIQKDPDRDYVKAFEDIRKSGVQYFGNATTEQLMQELYG